MIPGLLAEDIARSLREFIVTGYETETWPFAGKFDALVNKANNGDAFIKGPYVSIGLPFLKNTDRLDLFSGFSTEHSPFAHQEMSWRRLRSNGKPQSTIVATGTGSGKTECFLYPLLEHCQLNAGSGIKAIVIYPMNALAGDQAKRFASVIHDTPELHGKVRVGLFIGGAEVTDQNTMGAEQVITCKKTMRSHPPDILLTNYKMLDYLLMRPKDQRLWEHNQQDVLRYLVVDELHTFDGAQGSDLAMLIRRLKARLNVTDNSLTCIGTSATLGADKQVSELAKFASDIFDTHFDSGSIIGETRQTRDQFLGMLEFMMLDPGFTPEQLLEGYYPSIHEYLEAQARLFFGDDQAVDVISNEGRVALGDLLKRHFVTHNLLYKTNSNAVVLKDLIPAIQKQLPANLKNCPELVLISLLSLMSHARGSDYPGQPLVSIRLQVWARELRRIVSRVGNDSSQYPSDLHFSDDLKKEQGEVYLPIVQCNECHTTAWLTKMEQGTSHVEQELRTIYNAFFSSDKQTTVLLPLQSVTNTPPIQGLVKFLCVTCGHLQLSDQECVACQETVLTPVYEPSLNKSVKVGGVPTLKSQRLCPVCQASNSLLLFGSRAASLSSVAIHQSYASPINDDKKLIAFSDSVQDAAHRAGFFAARTWHNNIRMALSKAIHAQSETIALEDFFEFLPRFWLDSTLNEAAFDPIKYIVQFIAPNMESSESYQSLKRDGTLSNPDVLINQINRRLLWESLQEFGIQSRIGRSLERTGVASLGWNPDLIVTAADALIEVSREKLGHSLSEEKANFILWGIALKMKRQGAIYNPLMQKFIEAGADKWLLSRNVVSYLPDFSRYMKVPNFPAEAAEKGFDPLVPKNERGWYLRWVTQFVDVDLVDDRFMADLLYASMASLEGVGLLVSIESHKQHKVWALNQEKLVIYKNLSPMRLRAISLEEAVSDDSESEPSLNSFGNWFVPDVWREHLNNLPSLDHQFARKMAPPCLEYDPNPRTSFYRSFYLNGQIERVIAHEHTSLLERDYREKLEDRFISSDGDRKPWFENLLSATPTLEMGIDIGDLSSVLLCSVPPSQANYLQRAGRAGRKDGNSFVMTLASGNPHDLYFYAQPSEMIEGEVDAPAIFLNASMVLKRQLLAFCFDQWGMLSGEEHSIPQSMQPILDAVENTDQKKFPYSLLTFIKKERDELWEKFQLLLDKQITAETRNKLKGFLLGSGEAEFGIDVHVLNQIQLVVVERKALMKHQKDLESELKFLNKKPKDEALIEEIETLNAELAGIKRLKYELNRKDTFNFLTDEGLLPNYAFPEEGTTLHSVIYRKLSKPKTNEDGVPSNFESQVFEYSRPARSALSELAPESLFFANNRKVQIERIEMAKGENLESWRLCPSCSYSQRIAGVDEDVTCPRCNDPMWANTSQLRHMVRLRQVYANTREDKARIGDDADTREPIFFNRQMLIDFDPSDIALAYAMKSQAKPFGFEFIRKAKFREINFGKQGGSDQVFDVAGRGMARPGFRLCKECGMVQHQKNKTAHMFKCQYKEAEDGEGIIDCLYLYREYESEAIRILIPKLSGSDHEEQIQSFVAALQLGLKKHFGGKVDHLQITFNDEPIPGSTERANYLVLYDTVPGGTGYLHELLADPTHLMDMLKVSRDVIEKCSCQESPELDGCYKCLFAYRNSYGMESTSRTTALSMLAEILDGDISLEPVSHLGKISINPWVDSELEAKFPDALQALSNHALLGGIRIRTSKDIINGKVGFKLEIDERIYSVEIHANLGKKQGVMYPCEPDFLIRADREGDGALPVAVFLDGYKFHKNIVHEDLMKRQGIFLSRSILTWSLTWHDVSQAFAGSEVKVPNPLRENIENSPKSFIQKISTDKGLGEHNRIAELSPLLMLVKYLHQPSLEWWKNISMLRAMNWLDQSSMQSKELMDSIQEKAKTWPSQYQDQIANLDLAFATTQKFSEAGVDLVMHIGGAQDAIKSLDSSSLFLSVIYNVHDQDSEKALRVWQKLLQIVNVCQFLPNFLAATEKGLSDGNFSELTWAAAESAPMEESIWDGIMKLAQAEVRPWLSEFSQHDCPVPEICFELEDSKGMVVAESELAWPDHQVALLLDYQMDESKTVFQGRGWTVITINTLVSEVLDLLGAK
jgi:DEAD/DEAH box helicase domain-containing protein